MAARLLTLVNMKVHAHRVDLSAVLRIDARSTLNDRLFIEVVLPPKHFKHNCSIMAVGQAQNGFILSC